MNITESPKQYSSVFKPACFTVSGIDTPQCDVQILNGQNEVLGTKRFRGVTSCRVNAAPYMRTQIDVDPMGDYFTDVYATERSAECKIKCGGKVSQPVHMTAATDTAPTFRLLSDIAPARTIGRGQWDELSFITPDAIVDVTVQMYGDGLDAEISLSGSTAGKEIMTMVVHADDIAEMFAASTGKEPEELEQFTVEIEADGTHVATINYSMDSPQAGMRLGWVNEYGCMDYFSFPVICSRSVTVQKQKILSADGYTITGLRRDESTVVSSGYRKEKEILALSAILSAPKVWRTDGEKPLRMDVATTQVERMRHNRPAELRITLRESQPQVPQTMQ